MPDPNITRMTSRAVPVLRRPCLRDRVTVIGTGRLAIGLDVTELAMDRTYRCIAPLATVLTLGGRPPTNRDVQADDRGEAPSPSPEGAAPYDEAGCPVPFQSARRSKSGSEATVVSFDPLVRKLARLFACSNDQIPKCEEAPRRAEGFFREIPAASYSPRGLPPKYHRR